MITVEVGSHDGDLQTFGLHKNIVCQYSAFFKAACMGRFKEAETGKISLPDERADLFDLFVQWVYSQRPKQIFTELASPVWTNLTGLYILADKLQVPVFKNALMDYILCKVHRSMMNVTLLEVDFPSHSDISAAYENTPPTSPMRRFLAELFASSFLKDLPIKKDQVPKDYLYDLAIALRLGAEPAYGLPPVMYEVCRYHDHANGENPHCVASASPRTTR